MLSSHCENMLPYAAGRRAVLVDHRRYRPNVEVAPNCPRCDSPNTKFCYYNNYSLSQPRYFCKGCRRYWTKGGSLRNVPVGGGCRKNRRGKSLRSSTVVDTATAAGTGAAFSHRFPGGVRPDMLLEDMVGSPAGVCLPMSADKPAVADGPAIDLALLYAKFLNHQPAVEQCAVLPESAATTSGSSDMSPDAPPPDQPFRSQDGFGELSGSASTEALGELTFGVDQSCYDSLGMPTDAGELILPSTWHRQEAKYEPFDSLPEDAMSQLQDGVSGCEDVWSNALVACQGLEAALSCRP